MGEKEKPPARLVEIYSVSATMTEEAISDGYVFDATPSLVLNGITYAFDVTRDIASDTQVTFGATESLIDNVTPSVTIIDTIKLGNVLLDLKGGDAPKFTGVSLEPDKYEIYVEGIFNYYNSSMGFASLASYNDERVAGGCTLIEKYITGESYTYFVYVDAKDGYIFADDATVVINGEEKSLGYTHITASKKSYQVELFDSIVATPGEIITVNDNINVHVWETDDDSYGYNTLDEKATIEVPEDASIVNVSCLDLDFEGFEDYEEELIEGYDVGAYLTLNSVRIYTDKQTLTAKLTMPIQTGYSNSDAKIVIDDVEYLPISYVSGYATYELPIYDYSSIMPTALSIEDASTARFGTWGMIYYRYGDNTQTSVKEEIPGITSPNTGDNIILYVALLVVAMSGTIFMLYMKRNLSKTVENLA